MAAYRAVKAAFGGAESTTLEGKQPAGTEVGDIVCVEVMVDGAKVEPTITGFTKLGQQNTTVGESQTTAWFAKVATEAGEKAFTISWGGAKRYNAGVSVAIKEGTLEGIICQMKSNTTASKEMKFASATVPSANCCSVLMGGIDQTGTGTPPTNWTERQDNNIGTYVGTRDNPPAEATGEKVVTLTESRITNTAHIVVLPPPVASGRTAMIL